MLPIYGRKRETICLCGIKLKSLTGKNTGRCLKGVAHMLGYSDLLSRPSIEMNTVWETLVKRAHLKKKTKNKLVMSSGKNIWFQIQFSCSVSWHLLFSLVNRRLLFVVTCSWSKSCRLPGVILPGFTVMEKPQTSFNNSYSF